MRRTAAVLALLSLLGVGCRQKPAEPDVAELLSDLASGDADRSGKASLAILSKGDLAVPGLIDMLGVADPRLRARAATTLWGLGANAKAAAPALAKALADQDVEVRRAAASALGNMGVDAEPAVPALIEALDRDDPALRQLAAKALGAVGPAARSALPALERAGRSEGIHAAAEEARKKIQGGR